MFCISGFIRFEGIGKKQQQQQKKNKKKKKKKQTKKTPKNVLNTMNQTKRLLIFIKWCIFSIRFIIFYELRPAQ